MHNDYQFLEQNFMDAGKAAIVFAKITIEMNYVCKKELFDNYSEHGPYRTFHCHRVMSYINNKEWRAHDDLRSDHDVYVFVKELKAQLEEFIHVKANYEPKMVDRMRDLNRLGFKDVTETIS